MRPVRSAGGVVWRPAADGVEVCLVHRPRYDDWTLPKGKIEPGEHPLAAAVREVSEETGLRGVPQVRLGAVSYRTRDGEPKTVDYWSMRGHPEPGLAVAGEVDAVCWLPPAEAARRVTYPHDARTLRDFAALPPVTAVLVLVRHGRAARRRDWAGPDAARPLDPVGVAEARALAPVQALAAPGRLISASVRRCVQTLDPLARLLDLPIEVDPTLDEPPPDRDRAGYASGVAARLSELAATGAAAAVSGQGGVSELAATGAAAAVCGQGGVIRAALARLVGDGDPERYRTPKGDGWLLAFAGDRLVGAGRLGPADPTVLCGSR